MCLFSRYNTCTKDQQSRGNNKRVKGIMLNEKTKDKIIILDVSIPLNAKSIQQKVFIFTFYIRE